jgi:hypothetical protein
MPQLLVPLGSAAAALLQTWVAVLSVVSFVFDAAGFIELQDGSFAVSCLSIRQADGE